MKTKKIATRKTMMRKYGNEWKLLVNFGFLIEKDCRHFRIVKNLPEVEKFNKLVREHYKADATELVGEAMSEISMLADEMRNWYDNMPENLQGGSKGSEVSDAADALENVSEPDLSAIDGLKVQFRDFSGRLKSRSDRLCWATDRLGAVIDGIDEKIEELRKEKTEQLTYKEVFEAAKAAGAVNVSWEVELKNGYDTSKKVLAIDKFFAKFLDGKKADAQYGSLEQIGENGEVTFLNAKKVKKADDGFENVVTVETERHLDLGEPSEEEENEASALESVKEDLESIKDEMDGVSFPGMY